MIGSRDLIVSVISFIYNKFAVRIYRTQVYITEVIHTCVSNVHLTAICGTASEMCSCQLRVATKYFSNKDVAQHFAPM